MAASIGKKLPLSPGKNVWGRAEVVSANRFGGSWTEEKLRHLRNYLGAYAQLMKNRNFRTIYIDAFAGTGRWMAERRRPDLFGSPLEEFVHGSASLALQIQPYFSRYILIEKDEEKHEQLAELKAAHPNLNIEIRHGDANIELEKVCGATDWRTSRAVVFLDPFGMQVKWRAIETLGRTQAVDLWYLVPVGIALRRLLTRRALPPPEWQRTLDEALGDSGWRQAFYAVGSKTDLFGEEVEEVRRSGGDREIEAYVRARLLTAFRGVSPHVGHLSNSKNNIYSLMFACANPSEKAQAISMRIAKHLLLSN